MKGRFSGIFEHWNRRNTEYYQKAFSRLEKENKMTFNFAACLFASCWLIHRKMYGWAAAVFAAFAVISAVLGISLRLLCDDISVMYIIFYGITLIAWIVLGFFGNALYYKEVKSRIAKGYLEMEDYNPINPLWSMVSLFGIYVVVWCFPSWNDIDQSLIADSLGIFIALISWAIDYKKFHSRESAEPINVTEDSVNKYLNKSDPKYLTVAFFSFIAICVVDECLEKLNQIGNDEVTESVESRGFETGSASTTV